MSAIPGAVGLKQWPGPSCRRRAERRIVIVGTIVGGGLVRSVLLEAKMGIRVHARKLDRCFSASSGQRINEAQDVRKSFSVGFFCSPYHSSCAFPIVHYRVQTSLEPSTQY